MHKAHWHPNLYFVIHQQHGPLYGTHPHTDVAQAGGRRSHLRGAIDCREVQVCGSIGL